MTQRYNKDTIKKESLPKKKHEKKDGLSHPFAQKTFFHYICPTF